MIEYSPSAVTVVSSNSSIGPLPKVKLHFFLLLSYTKELLLTHNIITFLPNKLLSDNEKNPRA